VSASELTDTTVRYLYATAWIPTSDKEDIIAVPGGTAKALDIGANLLHCAMWTLRRLRAMDFEQLRPVEDEPVRVLGGRSFSRYEMLDPTLRMPGLEGALLRAAASVAPQEGLIQEGLARVSKEDEHGVRRLIRALDLDNRGPWKTVCGHCFAEAQAAGLVEQKGRIFKKVVFTDVEAAKSLRPRHDELRAERGAYFESDAELTNAVMADCLRAVADGYSPGGGDSL